MKIPNWTITLASQVCTDYSIDLPILEVKRKQFGYSGTQSWDGEKQKVTIRYSRSTPMWEKKLVLLHELAHCMMDKGEHHSEAFWDRAFELYKRYGLPLRKCRENERGYKRTAEHSYRKLQGLKPKPRRKSRVINRITSVPTYAIIGLHIDQKGKHWAVTSRAGGGVLMRWKGYKVSESVYNKLKARGYYVF
jgi:hypothetical protein